MTKDEINGLIIRIKKIMKTKVFMIKKTVAPTGIEPVLHA